MPGRSIAAVPARSSSRGDVDVAFSSSSRKATLSSSGPTIGIRMRCVCPSRGPRPCPGSSLAPPSDRPATLAAGTHPAPAALTPAASLRDDRADRLPAVRTANRDPPDAPRPSTTTGIRPHDARGDEQSASHHRPDHISAIGTERHVTYFRAALNDRKRKSHTNRRRPATAQAR